MDYPVHYPVRDKGEREGTGAELFLTDLAQGGGLHCVLILQNIVSAASVHTHWTQMMMTFGEQF